MKVLFLDIDGVLNSVKFMQKVVRRSLIADETTIDKAACELLQSFIAKHSDLVVVISSSWRQFHSLDQLKEILQGYGIDSSKIVGQTPVIPNTIRGEEIKSWLRTQFLKSNFPVTSIVILDDDTDMGPVMDYLVHTNVEEGLTESDLLKAEEVLKKPLPDIF